MVPLKLRSEDCSAFGRMVLQYLQSHPQTNMSQLARQVKISRAGLGWICLKRSGPDEETAQRVAQAIGADLLEIARVVHENKLENLSNLGGLNYTILIDGKTIKRPVPSEDAIAALNSVYRAFHQSTRSISATEKPSDFQLYKLAYEIVRQQFLKRKKSSRYRSQTENISVSEEG